MAGNIRSSVDMAALFTKARSDIEALLLRTVYVQYAQWKLQISGAFYIFSKENTDFIEEIVIEKIEKDMKERKIQGPIDDSTKAALTTVALLKILDRNPHVALCAEQQALSDMIWQPERILQKGEALMQVTSDSFQKDGYYGARFLVQTMSYMQVLAVLAKHLDNTMLYKASTLQRGDRKYRLLNDYSADWLNAQCDHVQKMMENLDDIGRSRQYRHVNKDDLTESTEHPLISPFAVLESRPTPSPWAIFMRAYRNSPQRARFAFYRTLLFTVRRYDVPHENIFPWLDLSGIYSDTQYGLFVQDFFQFLSLMHIPVIWDLLSKAMQAASDLRETVLAPWDDGVVTGLFDTVKASVRFIAHTGLALVSTMPLLLMGITSLPLLPIRIKMVELFDEEFIQDFALILLDFLEVGKNIALFSIMGAGLWNANAMISGLSVVANGPLGLWILPILSVQIAVLAWVATHMGYMLYQGASIVHDYFSDQWHSFLRQRHNQNNQILAQPNIHPDIHFNNMNDHEERVRHLLQQLAAAQMNPFPVPLNIPYFPPNNAFIFNNVYRYYPNYAGRIQQLNQQGDNDLDAQDEYGNPLNRN